MLDSVGTAPACPPQHGVESRDKLVQVERFQQVVISTGLKSRDAMFNGITCSQHENWQVLMASAPAAKERHSIFVRQAEVEDANIERSTVLRRLCGGCRSNTVDGQAVQLQSRHDACSDQFIVFNQENVHVC